MKYATCGWIVVIVSALATQAIGMVTPEQKCQAAKNTAAGVYARCRQNAEKTLALTSDNVKYGSAITKCENRFAAAWQKAIDNATAASAMCRDSPLGAADYKLEIDAHSDNIATALNGDGLTECSVDLATCTTDLGACSTTRDQCAASLAAYQAMAIGTDVIGPDGDLSFPIPGGIYSSKNCIASDAALVAGNIKKGATIFDVTGSATVVNTSDATATAGDIASGKTAYVNGDLVTGNLSCPAGPTCGNGVIEGSEECDWGTVGGATCYSATGGTRRNGILGCTAGSCTFDTSSCCTPVGGFCWFLGAVGQSCDATCTANGLVYNSATDTYAGSSGSDANCNAVLDALGVPAGTLMQWDWHSGLGCFQCVSCGDVIRFRETSNPTNGGASEATVRRACACD